MFSKTFLVLSFWLIANADDKEEEEEKYFDLTKERFCDLTCHISGEDYRDNTACDCTAPPVPNITIIEDNLFEFRKAILHRLNSFRNELAAGSIKKYPKASNMMVLNYDLALEYIAYCTVKKGLHIPSSSRCSRTLYDLFLTPSYSMQSVKVKDPKPDLASVKGALEYLELLFGRLDEIDESFIDKANSMKKFTPIQVLMTHGENKIGCTRATDPTNPSNNYRYLVYCILGDLGGYKDNYFPNTALYGKGEPCSACKYWHKCNTNYTNLCGELKDVPDYTWKIPPKRKKAETEKPAEAKGSAGDLCAGEILTAMLALHSFYLI